MRVLHLFLSLMLLTTTCFGQNLKPVRGMPFVNRGHKLGSGLVGCWPFNEGSGGQVFDLSGNGNTGLFVGDVAWTSGKFGSALNFPGSSDYLNCGTKASVLPNAWTVVCYAKTNDVVNNWLSTAGTFSSMGCVLQYTTTGKPLIYLGGSNYRFFAASAYTKIVDGNYHQIAFTCPGSGQTDIVNSAMYVDAQNIAEDAPAFTVGAQSAKTNFLIGADDTSPTRHYSGVLVYFYLYNRVLSASEIALLYREPFCMFKRNLLEESMYSVAAPSVIPTPYYYQATFSVPFLTLLVLSIYCCLRRRKCAA